MRARLSGHSLRNGPLSSADLFPCLREKARARFEPGTYGLKIERSYVSPNRFGDGFLDCEIKCQGSI